MTLLNRLLNCSESKPFQTQEAHSLCEETLGAIENHREPQDKELIIGTLFTVLEKMKEHRYEIKDLKTRAVEVITQADPDNPYLSSFIEDHLRD